MISAWHLFWIIPVCCCLGVLVTALAVAAGRDRIDD